jgi:formate-dependent nitrite reductase membrane component NrfD
VRKPESGTKPNLFYVEGSNWTLDPTVTSEVPETYMWADVDDKPQNRKRELSSRNHNGKKSEEGPIKTGGKVAEHMVQVAYDISHKKAWHWPVAAYMTSKAIASGVYLMLWGAVVSGFISLSGAWSMLLETIIVFAMIATGVLLCVDLERPDRFLRVIMHPQWRSWLARGAYLIVGFGGMVSLLLGVNIGAMINVSALQSAQKYLEQPNVSLMLSLFTVPLAVGVAVYTAFLFRQAKGREIWQKKSLPLHMGVQTLIAGASICILLNCVFERLDNLYRLSVSVLVIGLVISGAIICVGHIFDRTRVKGVRIANQHLLSGKYRYWFWIGGVALGHLVPIVVVFSRSDLVGVICGLSAICGLYCYEYGFVLCAQEVPNS